MVGFVLLVIIIILYQFSQKYKQLKREERGDFTISDLSQDESVSDQSLLLKFPSLNLNPQDASVSRVPTNNLIHSEGEENMQDNDLLNRPTKERFPRKYIAFEEKSVRKLNESIVFHAKVNNLVILDIEMASVVDRVLAAGYIYSAIVTFAKGYDN